MGKGIHAMPLRCRRRVEETVLAADMLTVKGKQMLAGCRKNRAKAISFSIVDLSRGHFI